MSVEVGQVWQLAVNMSLLSQAIQNVWTYRVTATAGDVSAANLAEAFWGHVRDEYRALAVPSPVALFVSVQAKQLDDPLGGLGEFAIPAAQQQGTRTFVQGDQYAASFEAMGFRLAVGSRVTRPGQKRIPFLLERDVTQNVIQPEFAGLATAVVEICTELVVMGAPALGTTLESVVVGYEPGFVVPTRIQPVIGRVANTFVTSQVSRKQR